MPRTSIPAWLTFATAAVIAFCVTSGETICCGGDLDQVRHDVRDRSSDKPRRRRRAETSHHHCEEDDPPGFFTQLAGRTVVFTTTSPWWLPHSLLGDDFSDWAEFPAAPYADGYDGYLVIDSPAPMDTRGWSVRLSTEYGTNFDDVSRMGTRIIADTASRFGIDSEWNQWFENTRDGADGLATGDVNLIYRFAQHEHASFRSGVGFNWIADAEAADFGVNLTYGVDIFPAEPFVVSATMDIGSLGDALFFHVRSTSGVTIGPAEVFAGFDYHRIGSVDLYGLLAGIRIWF